MDSTVDLATFDSAYENRSAPWVIDQNQPAIVELERAGWIRGAVLDAGCGSGEHTIHLTELGYDVEGVDLSERALEQARANASARGVPARFAVADALDLGARPRYDTVLDSALFHVFGATDRPAYARSLHAACRPGALVHVLALSDTQAATGPRISDTAIRGAFGNGWDIEDLSPHRYRGIVRYPEDADRLGVAIGEPADTAAWLARIRRL